MIAWLEGPHSGPRSVRVRKLITDPQPPLCTARLRQDVSAGLGVAQAIEAKAVGFLAEMPTNAPTMDDNAWCATVGLAAGLRASVCSWRDLSFDMKRRGLPLQQDRAR